MSDTDKPPPKAPLAPYGSHERAQQGQPFPITPSEYSQSVKEHAAKIAQARKAANIERSRS